MKTIITFTCLYCDSTYDKEVDVNESRLIMLPDEEQMFIGVCPSCMEKKHGSIKKATEAFLKRHRIKNGK